MEASEPTCPAPSARDQPAPPPGILGGPGGQASPHLTLGPVILPPEQGLPPTVFLKALPVPLYHTVPPGSLQPRAPLVTGNLDGTSVPLILSPLLQPEGPSPTQVGKPASAALTVNIVGTLPVLSPGLGPTLSSTGRARNAGKYLCPHCGRDCLKPSVLEKHIRSHTGERPFPCTTCGIAFKTQSNLYKHRRTQTHLNNSRLSLESEGGGSSLLEEGDRAGEPTTGDNRGDEGESTLFPGSKNLDRTVEAAPYLGSTLHREAPADSTPMTPPGLPLASPQPRRKLPEPKPCSLQRQQDLCTEKPWDPRASEGRLRKCESTDSGYLSRSDSAEQPLVASSPLHSLSEHSGESEGEGGPGSGPRGNKSDPGAPGTSLELEKKKLEERIAQLISHNQAVVDDPQLDHVRPRKTVLSKQGSIDLPMPYTYKDSFHFDIRALEPSRRRTALSPARSTITPLEKSRPLFFHSVPTQLSTTVECVPVTRSNSLPFVEGSKIWPEPRDPQDACPGMQKPLSSRLVSVRPGCHPGLTLADIPSHPRALVRQAAVEDLPCTPTGNPTAGAEDLDRTRAVMRERAVCKGGGSKKCSPRKPKMFSHEKWQVYGNETFKRIYQKMKTSHQGAQKPREPRQRHRAEPELPTQEEVPRSENMAPTQGGRTPVLGHSSAEAKPGSWGSQAALEGPLEAESPKPLTAVAKAKSSLTLGGENTLCLSSRSLLLPAREKLGCQLTPVPGPHKGVDLEASRLALPGSRGEATKETCSWAQTALRETSGGLGDPQPVEDKFPSERKRMKVEGLGPQEQPETLGEESSGSSVLAVSRPPQKRDSDHGEVRVASYDSAQQVPEVQESFDASLVVSDAALGCSGPGGTTSSLPSVSRHSGHPSVWAAQLQTPGIPAAPAEDTFAPKYLLRLPQGENRSPSATPRPERGPDSVYASARSKEQASRSGSGLGVPWSPGPSSAPGKAEEPSGARMMDRTEGEDVGGEKGGQANSSSSASRDCPGSPTGATCEAASILPAHVCDTQMGQDMTSETHATHYFCTESSSAIVRTSGVLLNPWTSVQKLGVPPKNGLEGPPPDPKEGLPTCCPFQVHRFLTSFTRPQGLSLGQPKLLWTPLGTPEGCGTQSSFPSLRAEPQLTWCCLSRSLPLPSEQQRATSGHSALHPGERTLWDAGSDMLHKSHGGRIKTSRGGGGGGGPMKAPELSYPTVPGTRVQDPVSTLQWKKGLCRRRVKTSHGNSKKKLRLHSKRCEGSFWQSRAQLRARRRLYKPPWMPRRSCLPHRLEGSEPPGTLGKASSEVAGLSLQGEPSCTSTEVSTGHGSEERKEDSSGQILEPISPTTSPETIREIRKSTLKDISPSAGELDDYSREKDPGDRSGLSLHSNACLVVAKEDLLPQGKDLEVGLLGMRLLPPRDQVCIDPSLCISPDMLEPSSSGPKGTFPCHDVVTSVAAICVSVGVRAAHESSAVDSAESLPGETLSHSSSESRAIAESPGQACSPGRPSPRQRSPGKSHLEILASGPSSPTSNQEEGELQVDVPSRGQHGCGDAAMRCTASGHDSGMGRAARLITPKGHVPLSDQEPSEVPEAPLRSIRKRSLEGMRKQTRVELSDTSSDDEDRLVIEI